MEAEYGWTTISEFVTDGTDTWLETEKYLYYSPTEAHALFAEHIAAHGWTLAE